MRYEHGVKAFVQLAGHPELGYLFLHKADPHPTGHTIDVPGGRLNMTTNESWADGARREVAEETNLTVVEEPLLLAQHEIELPHVHLRRDYCLVKAAGALSLDPVEHDGYLLRSIADAVRLPYLDPYLTAVLEDPRVARYL